MNKFVKTSMIIATLLLTTASTALATASLNDRHSGSEVVSETTRYEDGPMAGGWWTRGKSGSNLISEYKHYTKEGRGSCRNGNATFSDGGWKPAETWSKSKVGYALLGGNKVYYDYK